MLPHPPISRPGETSREPREHPIRAFDDVFRGGRMLLLGCAVLGVLGCDGSTVPEQTPVDVAATSEPESRRGYEIPIPSIEFWESSTTPKFFYEMRFDPSETPGGPPRLHRNGWARAFYANGSIEREGAYRYDASLERSERVGEWTYYDQDGSVLRVEQRGGPIVWTGPDQLIPPPKPQDP